MFLPKGPERSCSSQAAFQRPLIFHQSKDHSNYNNPKLHTSKNENRLFFVVALTAKALHNCWVSPSFATGCEKRSVCSSELGTLLKKHIFLMFWNFFVLVAAIKKDVGVWECYQETRNGGENGMTLIFSKFSKCSILFFLPVRTA